MKTLDLNRMAVIKGGGYCETLKLIVENNVLSEGALEGYGNYCWDTDIDSSLQDLY